MNQLTLSFNKSEAEAARDEGIRVAVDHAERVEPGWNDLADKMFREWLQGWPVGYKFLIEDFRRSAEIRGLPVPPSKRAFGGLALRAKKNDLIKSCGLSATTSQNQHRCFATKWEKI